MKITDLTENDCVLISTKEEAEAIAKLLNKAGIVKPVSKENFRADWMDIGNWPYLYIMNGKHADLYRDSKEWKVIPASKFLKPSLKKRVKDLEDRIEILEICLNQEQSTNFKGNENTCLIDEATDIEVHFDEVEKLPEKWCVKLTEENYRAIDSKYVYPNGYHHCHIVSTNNWSKYKQDGYTEISFETFKRLVLKQDEEPSEFEVNKWYKKSDTSLLFYPVAIKDVHVAKAYGFDTDGVWQPDDGSFTWGLSDCIPATDEEVKEAIIKEAERRGFKEGVTIISLNSKGKLILWSQPTIMHYRIKDNDIVCSSNSMFYAQLFKDGKWAEIVSEPEAIDFSKAGQYVCFDNNPKHVYVTTGWANERHFAATNVRTGDHSNMFIIKNFKPYKGQLTLSN